MDCPGEHHLPPNRNFFPIRIPADKQVACLRCEAQTKLSVSQDESCVAGRASDSQDSVGWRLSLRADALPIGHHSLCLDLLQIPAGKQLGLNPPENRGQPGETIQGKIELPLFQQGPLALGLCSRLSFQIETLEIYRSASTQAVLLPSGKHNFILSPGEFPPTAYSPFPLFHPSEWVFLLALFSMGLREGGLK